MLNSTEHAIILPHQSKMLIIFSELSNVKFILFINVKLRTVVDILTFMSRINWHFKIHEHEKVYNIRQWLFEIVILCIFKQDSF